MNEPTVILLVEDELPVRKLIAEALHASGYIVRSAGSAADAIVAFGKQSGDIVLLLTDVDLGRGMSGIELAQYLKQLRPGLKVMLMSGSPVAKASNGDIPFIRKPFAGPILMAKIDAVLAHEDELFRRDCAWIKQSLARRYPQVHVECEEELGDQYVVRLRRDPKLPGEEVRFSVGEYLEGKWEHRISAAVDRLDSQ